jgi:acetyltransferase-like isoleucine patch superfamily enzyme
MCDKFWNGRLLGLFSFSFILFEKLLSSFISKIYSLLFTINVKSSSLIKVNGKIWYRYPKVISVGRGVAIGNNCVFSSEHNINCYLIIEDGVSIGNNCYLDFTGGLIIRKNTHIAHGVSISTHHHGYDYKSSPIGVAKCISESVFIGNDVRILHNATNIGAESVIGTASVVTKNVPINAIVAGNPAVVIKYK